MKQYQADFSLKRKQRGLSFYVICIQYTKFWPWKAEDFNRISIEERKISSSLNKQKNHRPGRNYFNPWTYKQIHTATVVQGGWGGGGGWNPTTEFRYFAVFWKDFTISGKPLIFCAAESLWRHQQRSPSCPPSWILPRNGNQVKSG